MDSSPLQILLYLQDFLTRIRNFSLNDAGPYECVSTNSLGRADHVIRIYGNAYLLFDDHKIPADHYLILEN